MTRSTNLFACLAAAAIALVPACKSSSDQGSDSKAGPRGGEITVFAAASLTDAFKAVGQKFEEKNPGIEVTFNFAGSQSLRTQIEHGARPEVFASANPKHMNALEEQKLVDAPGLFAHNRMVIAVPAGNPAGIEKLADLAGAERIVLAGKDVPAGAYAEKVLEKASTELGDDFKKRVLDHVVSRELDVRQTLQKVVLGEANAVMVYATDAASAGDKVETVEIPAADNVIADYPIATVSGAKKPKLGRKFIDFVHSETGGETLEKFGFQPAGGAEKTARAANAP